MGFAMRLRFAGSGFMTNEEVILQYSLELSGRYPRIAQERDLDQKILCAPSGN